MISNNKIIFLNISKQRSTSTRDLFSNTNYFNTFSSFLEQIWFPEYIKNISTILLIYKKHNMYLKIEKLRQKS